MAVRVVGGRAVEVLGSNGGTCVQCRRMTAEFPYWTGETTMIWTCTFCESGLFALQDYEPYSDSE